jgi:phospholipid-binding lipoprotein MlaA
VNHPTSLTDAAAPSDVVTVDELIEEDLAEEGRVEAMDPLQPVNRVMHAFNDGFYNFLLEPVSTAYGTVMPDTVERGVANAFTNLRYPQRLVGNVLQGKMEGAARETGKFVVNSTVGGLGLMKASVRFENLSTPSEDLGQVLGKWRLGHGPYLVLPVLGPNSLRDLVGMAGDGFLDPVHYAGSTGVRLGARGLENVNRSSDILASYDALTAGSIDPYLALRDAYLQARNEAVRR